MNNKIKEISARLKQSWESMDSNVFNEVEAMVGELALSGFDKDLDYASTGIKLYRDELGFIFYAYSEINGTYRVPHNHGDAWVIYAVVEGAVEMGTYVNWIQPNNESQLILKDKRILNRGDAKIYYPGDIHDTRCLSKEAQILRFTSCDLQVEVASGRMKRFGEYET